MQADQTQYPISVVEQETGISKELLRMWERRYEFPVPRRDPAGNRLYSRDQIDRLQDINRLLAAGYRPGFVVGADPAKLERLLQELPQPDGNTTDDDATASIDSLWESLCALDLRRSRWLLQQHLANEGVRRFVLRITAPLYQQLARARLDESLPEFLQQLARELLLEALNLAMAQIPAPVEKGLTILLASLPGEDRPVELQMTRTLLLSAGVDVLYMGAEPQSIDIIDCLQRCHPEVLQIAVSANGTLGNAQQQVDALRQQIPAQTTMWLSGSGAEAMASEGGIPCFRRLSDLLAAVEAWQQPLRDR